MIGNLFLFLLLWYDNELSSFYFYSYLLGNPSYSRHYFGIFNFFKDRNATFVGNDRPFSGSNQLFVPLFDMESQLLDEKRNQKR